MHSRGPFPAYLNALFGDPEIAAALSPQAQLTAMIEVEAALAAAQADLGVIPLEASKAIIALTRECPLSPSDLSQATGRDGVPVPGLVAALRSVLGAEHAPHLHRGATSQDILDTATCLTLGAALDILEKRLKRAMAALADLAEAHRRTVMVARTRGQQATPTTFGLKAAGWLLPLLRLAERLHHLRKDALPLSFGGASGTLAAYGPKAREIERRMAERLGLAMAIMPWHAQRDGLIEVGCWLTALTAALGKIATDVALLAQSEVNEVRLADAGGSSTMPNKANPTRAETLAALARYATGLMTALQQAALSAQERDGAAWQLEWLSLPPLVEAAGCALAQGQWMLASLVRRRGAHARQLRGGKGPALGRGRQLRFGRAHATAGCASTGEGGLPVKLERRPASDRRSKQLHRRSARLVRLA